MPDPVVRVRDTETDEEFSILQSDYQQDPTAYQIVEGQQIVIDPTAGVAPVTTGIEATAETLGGPVIGQQLTAEQLTGKARGLTAEALEGGWGGRAAAVGRGVLEAGTLGLSEGAFFDAETELEQELEGMRRAVVGQYQAGGELIGDVGLTILSGGTSLAASGAKATAPGMIARVGARIAPRGAGLGRQVIGGAFEQAAMDVGKAMAKGAMDDEPLSLSALASTATTSALLGGGAAGLLGAAGRGLRRVAERPALTPAEKLLGASSDPAALSRLLREAEEGTLSRAAGDLAAPKVRKPVQVGRLFSKRGKAPEMTRRAASELIEQVTARGTRAAQVRTVLDDVLMGSRAAGREVPEELAARVRMALDDHAIASSDAAKFLPSIATDAEKAAAGQAVSVTSDAVPAMRRLDMVDRDLAEALAEVRKSLPDPAAIAAAAPEAQGMLSRGADALGIYEGAADVAGAVGTKLPSLRSLPGIGPLVAGVAKVRMLAKAASKIGLLPGSGLTEAAEVAAVAADRFRSVIAQASRGRVVTSGALPRALRVASVAGARAMAADVLASDPGQVAQAIEGRFGDLPDDMRGQLVQTAQRRIAYLQEVAPKPPSGFGAVPQLWSPTPSQARQFGEVASALDAPLEAVAALFSGGWRYPLEVVAGVRSVYPEVYAETQGELISNAPALVRNNPRTLVAQWARLFDVQILPELQPSYSTPSTPAPALTPQGMPPASAKSPAVESATVRPHMSR